MGLLDQGKEFLSSKEGKEFIEDGKDAYATFNKTEGSNTDKAKAVYAGYKKDEEEDKKKESKNKD